MCKIEKKNNNYCTQEIKTKRKERKEKTSDSGRVGQAASASAFVNIWIMIEDEINIVLMVFMSSVLLFVILPRKWISVIAIQGT